MNILSKLGDHPWTLITSNTSAFLIGVALLWLAYQLGADSHAYLVNWVICLFGAVVGWGVGLMSSPSSEQESAKFSGVTKTVSAFLSGYILSKLDPLIQTVLQSDQFFQEAVLVRIAFFLTTFFLSMVIVYINRVYFLNVIESSEPDH
jgi:hypothetical protein